MLTLPTATVPTANLANCQVTPDPAWSNSTFGPGIQGALAATNIIASQGALDPWSGGGILPTVRGCVLMVLLLFLFVCTRQCPCFVRAPISIHWLLGLLTSTCAVVCYDTMCALSTCHPD
jgi:hypothetical protein